MYAEERRRQIASLTAVEGRVNVTELSERFEVTAETIRRDLAVLDREGVVHRVHGGAVASQSLSNCGTYPRHSAAFRLRRESRHRPSCAGFSTPRRRQHFPRRGHYD